MKAFALALKTLLPAFAAAVAPVASAHVALAATSVGTNFNSCSIVTQAEAAKALGHAVSAGVLGHATVEGGLACVFYGASAPKPHDPDVAQVDTVRVAVVKGPNASKWYKDYKSKVRAQTIKGYGDQAFFDGYASLSVLKGEYYLRVAVVPIGPADVLKDEEELAKAVLPKL